VRTRQTHWAVTRRAWPMAALLVVAACGSTPAQSASTGPATIAPATATAVVSATAATPAPSTAPASPEAGTYRNAKSEWSAVDFTVTIPDGWTTENGHVYQKYADTPDQLRFYAFAPDTIYGDACKGSAGEHTRVGPSVEDLLTTLLEQRGPKVTGPTDTTVGGRPATRLDLAVPDGTDLKSCNLEGGGLQVWLSHAADGYLVLVPDGVASVYVVDADGTRQVFVTEHPPAMSDEDAADVQAILDSIRIGG
jgi:hypothetical protein